MTAVVLLGSSGAGKSTISSAIESACLAGDLPLVKCIDSDRQISTPNGGNIFRIYLEYGWLGANSVIDWRERALLSEWMATDEPTLIAASPFLPSRLPEWDRFVARVEPKFLYLAQEPEDVLRALKYRREKHERDADLARHRNFGSWDARIRTIRVNDGTFRLLDDEVALANIIESRRLLLPVYERLAGPDHTIPAIRGPEDSELAAVVGRVLTLLA